jgi:hypothetical protein
MCSLTNPEKKKSSGLKMGDLGGQGIDPAHSNQCPGHQRAVALPGDSRVICYREFYIGQVFMKYPAHSRHGHHTAQTWTCTKNVR